MPGRRTTVAGAGRISAGPGDTLYVEPDTAKLNLLDAESGALAN
ncbi:hypothetical protein X773_13735 [Mesorhizobium sp. LSJC285A00]|nr:hypothetical protein X771_18585 [Mesorhizobium sp. LSJC277A00]ESW81728.1 hypothetical protein X773_13735 [Mesorhizobium sp. LSJC285A00]ESX15640.1 hypothetical protein X766_25295 [Mesorhizobium sp. LSJC255A00]ESX23031.1 hypothetical protein X767_17105 [Mesorhizobium sp. LSJC264A00]ESX25635.1 hypothetical protein X765_25390 [Mesorhizobium sp. LSHC440B00]ESX33764.1 hypothetical protein X763_24865 [Mesorhizobium sp. LSHC432A00]ESX45014.1 hypothetical protein X764_06375 [Mesorhizobium sp. LSHC4